jgi:transposase
MKVNVSARHAAVRLLSGPGKPSIKQVAKQIRMSPSFVRKVWKHFQAKNMVLPGPKRASNLKLTSTARDIIKKLASTKGLSASGLISATLQTKHNLGISSRSVRRCLKDEGYSHVAPKTVPHLTAAQRASRVAFAQKFKRQAWAGVLFTDSK